MIKRFAAAAGLLLCVFSTTTVYAEDNTQVGRYLTTVNKPSAAQTDLLSQTLQVRFPQTVQTIGEAINYLLKFSGYSLIEASHRSTALQNTLSKPLPAVDRNFGPLSLRDGLTTLIGPAFTLKPDILNRTIDFKLKPSFTHNPEDKDND